MKSVTFEKQHNVECKGLQTQLWYAWLNIMPPKPDDLQVRGQVLVGNPGVYAILRRTEPQGKNTAILLLDLFLVQQPGEWIQKVTWTEASYHEVLWNGEFTQVEVFCEDEMIVSVPVVIVS